MNRIFLSALLAASAAALPSPSPSQAPALPISDFSKTSFDKPITPEEALANVKVETADTGPNKLNKPVANSFLAEAPPPPECSNPRIRQEWDDYGDDNRHTFMGAIKCLMGQKDSGQFPQSTSRYEDLVALHQELTDEVHDNRIFLMFHRYYLWTFEEILRNECGFDRDLPWWDEQKYAGKFHESSIFSDEYFGAVNVGGECVKDGQFSDLTLHVGPGPNGPDTNKPHCLARNGNEEWSKNTNSAMVDACNQHTDYAGMAECAETGAHAWGHNAVGSVMQDKYASPGDPTFFLHHAFIDRNFRIWQNNGFPSRVQNIDGTDHNGNQITLDTTISVRGLRDDVKIRDIINTLGEKLCYKYSY